VSKGTAVVAGALALRPGVGGHTWVFLQYLLGFRRLGWDVLFLDRLDPAMCVDSAGRSCPPRESWNVRYFLEVMERFGLDNCYSLVITGDPDFIGLSRRTVLERVGDSALLLNVMGYFTEPEILGRAPKRVFLDIDPGFGQMWRALGQADVFEGHDAYVTIGENIGRSECTIPTCGLTWITTPQPVVLAHWPAQTADHNGAFTTIATWRGAYDSVEYRGRKYGLRAHEFRRFVSLPQASDQRFELALDIDATDSADRGLLRDHAWSFADPGCAARDPWSYQAYIQHSRAEFMVAKNMYVQTRSGWLSDRSLCYLASGRPVLAQDTDLSERYPTGAGLVTFSTLDDAIAGAADIVADYPRHARAARAVAEEHFDSDIVLNRLVAQLGIA
jgi:hypothetical protein